MPRVAPFSLLFLFKVFTGNPPTTFEHALLMQSLVCGTEWPLLNNFVPKFHSDFKVGSSLTLSHSWNIAHRVTKFGQKHPYLVLLGTSSLYRCVIFQLGYMERMSKQSHPLPLNCRFWRISVNDNISSGKCLRTFIFASRHMYLIPGNRFTSSAFGLNLELCY